MFKNNSLKIVNERFMINDNDFFNAPESGFDLRQSPA